jgi:hypothetical protein
MKNTLVTALAIFVFLQGCAGRAANPVMVDQVGDNQKSCETLQTELASIQAQIQKLVPESDKTSKNVGLGVAGFFLIVPWFFMDLSDAEKAEINAYNMRYNKLTMIATQKKCEFLQVTPDAPDKTLEAKTEKPIQADGAKGAKVSNDLPSPANRLENLDSLFKKGLITKQEYDSKKAEILKNL